MTWRNSVRNFLVGTTYEEVAVVAPTEVKSRLVLVPLEAPEPAMAMEEAAISDIRRAELFSDATVLSSQDPAVRQATFRDRFVPLAKAAQAETRARLQLGADVPVTPRPAPLVTSPEIDRAEKLAQRRSYQGLTPVMRKLTA
jgi:hypothetical protein